jgi:hypothetical protein
LIFTEEQVGLPEPADALGEVRLRRLSAERRRQLVQVLLQLHGLAAHARENARVVGNEVELGRDQLLRPLLLYREQDRRGVAARDPAVPQRLRDAVRDHRLPVRYRVVDGVLERYPRVAVALLAQAPEHLQRDPVSVAVERREVLRADRVQHPGDDRPRDRDQGGDHVRHGRRLALLPDLDRKLLDLCGHWDSDASSGPGRGVRGP